MFKREHHLRIAAILQSLNSELLSQHGCLFGGGTAIVLAHQEYRESLDIDFLVSDLPGYQSLRSLIKEKGINVLAREGCTLDTMGSVRTDQYGIRTMLIVANVEIKLEIILEGRITLEPPVEKICGIHTLTALDMAASKLLANSDRWSDDSTFSRDLIDLAMLELPREKLNLALKKAAFAYGESCERDLNKAIATLSRRKGRLEECMSALKIDTLPLAVLWKNIRSLKTS